MSPSAPIDAETRITSIDTLRGFAVLGILIMNIQSFAMIEAAYFDPSQYGDLSGVNWWVWALGHAFADQKFMSIFSMLFGAGIILATERRDKLGLPSLAYHVSRNLWLLVFGLLHAYLIWYGDILVTYALAAFLLYWVRGLRARWLLILGALVLSIPALISVTVTFAPPDVLEELAADFTYTPEQISAELSAYRGTWLQALDRRAYSSWEMHSTALPFYLIWRAGGLMLIGMGLYKLGILAGTRSPHFYTKLALVGFGIGLPLVTSSVITLTRADYDPMVSQLGMGMLFNYLGSIAMALAYIGLVMRLAQTSRLLGLQKRLAAVGRMAFTNYIAQSVICTTLFYGFGFGLFGYVDRWEQVLIVLTIWAAQLRVSSLWLARFKFGPLEWLWRSLTYFKLQPLSNKTQAP